MNNTVQDFLALNKDFCFHTLKVGLHNTEYTPCAGLLCLERYCAGFYCGKILLELFFLFPLSLWRARPEGTGPVPFLFLLITCFLFSGNLHREGKPQHDKLNPDKIKQKYSFQEIDHGLFLLSLPFGPVPSGRSLQALSLFLFGSFPLPLGPFPLFPLASVERRRRETRG